MYGTPDGTWNLWGIDLILFNLIDIEKSDIKSLCWLLRPDSDTDNLSFVSKDIHHGDKISYTNEKPL